MAGDDVLMTTVSAAQEPPSFFFFFCTEHHALGRKDGGLHSSRHCLEYREPADYK